MDDTAKTRKSPRHGGGGGGFGRSRIPKLRTTLSQQGSSSSSASSQGTALYQSTPRRSSAVKPSRKITGALLQLAGPSKVPSAGSSKPQQRRSPDKPSSTQNLRSSAQKLRSPLTQEKLSRSKHTKKSPFKQKQQTPSKQKKSSPPKHKQQSLSKQKQQSSSKQKSQSPFIRKQRSPSKKEQGSPLDQVRSTTKPKPSSARRASTQQLSPLTPSRRQLGAGSVGRRSSQALTGTRSPSRVTPSSSPRHSSAVDSDKSGRLSSSSSRRRQSYSHSLRRSLYTPAGSATRITRSSLGLAKTSEEKHESIIAPVATPARLRDTSAHRTSSRSSSLFMPTVRLNTPFRPKTPKRVLRAEPERKEEASPLYSKEQHKEWDLQVAEWLRRSMKLCYVSALTGFDVHTTNLKNSYQKTLRNKVCSCVPFSVQVSLEPQHCFSRSLDTTDVVCLTISYSVPKDWDLQPADAKQRDRTKLLYKSFMVKADLRDDQADEAGVCWYPLYFYTGRESIHHVVMDWLQDSFSAVVSVRGLNSTALLWAAGLWLTQSCTGNSNKEGTVDLRYEVTAPSGAGWRQRYARSGQGVTETTMTLSMSASQMSKITACVIPDQSSTVMSGAERDLFHAVLLHLMADLTCLPREAYRLSYVKTCCVALSKTGQVKVTCRRHLLGMLKWLLELHREDSLLDQVNTASRSRQYSDSSLESPKSY